MPTANEEIQDRAFSHAVNVEKFANGQVRKILRLLSGANERLAAQLAKAIEKMPASSVSVQRLESLLMSTRALLNETFKLTNDQLQLDLQDFAELEASFQAMTLTEALPAFVHVATVTGAQVYAVASARPFQGVLLKNAMEGVDEATSKRVQQTIMSGIVENRTTDQIVREIRGSKAANYADGILEKSRRDVETIVRSSISSVAATGQDLIAKKNTDIIKGVRWTSTLDLRTSEKCRIRDNKLYTADTHKPVGHSLPWLSGPGRCHYNCRSTQTQVLKSWREMGIDMDGDANMATTRASLDGQVPADKSYATWLKQQSATRQDDILGETRGKLMREGGLSLQDMYSMKGSYLSLDELRAKESSAFKKAGL